MTWTPDRGTIRINGQEAKINTVQDAQHYGIGIIHQEISLAENMSIADNLFMGERNQGRSAFERPGNGSQVAGGPGRDGAERRRTYKGAGPEHCETTDGGDQQGAAVERQDHRDGRTDFFL